MMNIPVIGMLRTCRTSSVPTAENALNFSEQQQPEVAAAMKVPFLDQSRWIRN